MRLLLGSFLVFGLLVVVGCGARGLKSDPSTASSAAPVPSSSSLQPTNPSADPGNDNTIAVTAGADTASVNIHVTSAAASENALALGKVSDGFAANTGAIVHQASADSIVIFGPGLSGSMSIIISGPKDIGVSNVRSVQAKDGTQGVAFDAVIGSSSALGARTVYLKAGNNDITAFAGGLEVQP